MSKNDLNTVIQLLHENNCSITPEQLKNHIEQALVRQNSMLQGIIQEPCEEEKMITDKNIVYKSPVNNRRNMTKRNLVTYIILVLIIVILLVSNFVMIYIIFIRNPFDQTKNGEILVTKRGESFGGPGGISLLDDAEKAELTFQDKITSGNALEILDDNGQQILLSLTFIYTNGKKGNKSGDINSLVPVLHLSPLDLNPKEYINETIIYGDYQNIQNPFRQGKLTFVIVGVRFETTHGRVKLFGSDNGTAYKESFKDYFVGYVQG